ncbi:MAG: galactokinase [Trueperaceae bacterium]|nr:galactokinase [Trueperaceae bacterium]
MNASDTPKGRATAAFEETYGGEPTALVRAPGRVNMIGEHTDYNDGFVLPMAIELDAFVALTPRDDGVVRIHAVDLDEEGAFDVASVRSRDARGDASARPGGWLEYGRGVAWALQADGLTLRGFDATLASDVPVGAGLSSSAAVELALAAAFGVSSRLPWDATAMARRMQRAENLWVGVQTGIMDQLVVARGVEGHALLIDCRDLHTRPVPLPSGVAVVILDTSTRRSLVGSAYDDRRRACEAAAALLGVTALRDVDEAHLERGRADLDDVTYRRARHVVRENARTLAAAEAMAAGDARALGAAMDESHASLRDDFEVSSSALDAIVAAARAAPGCLGARMTGAGFGGCAVALIEERDVAEAIGRIERTYREETGHHARVYVSRAAAGAGPVTLP